MSALKTEVHTSDFEMDSPRAATYPRQGLAGAVSTAGTALAVVGLGAGATVLGLSADALATYDATHVPASRLLPLWPDEFDIRPTVAMVACAAVIVLGNAAVLAGGRLGFMRQRPVLHAGVSALAAAAGLVAAVVAVACFYGMGGDERDTLESWTCRWEGVYMATRPHFGTLCRQSRAGAYVSAVLVPVQMLALGAAGWRVVVERKGMTEFVPRREKREGSVPSSRGDA